MENTRKAHIQKLVLLGMIRKQSPIPIRRAHVHTVEQKNQKNISMNMAPQSLIGRKTIQPVQQYLPVKMETISKALSAK